MKFITKMILAITAINTIGCLDYAILPDPNTLSSNQGDSISHSTNNAVPISHNTSTITYAGQTYSTIQIGTQWWMAQNLNYSGGINSVGYCYNYSSDSCEKYGRLYSWSEMMGISRLYDSTQYQKSSILVDTSTKYQGICPTGWHVPTKNDWNILITNVGGVNNAGKALKANSGWKENTGTNKYPGVDNYDFHALPGGYGTFVSATVYYNFYSYNFFAIGQQGNWWSSGEIGATMASYMALSYDSWHIYDFINEKSAAAALRCIKD